MRFHSWTISYNTLTTLFSKWPWLLVRPFECFPNIFIFINTNFELLRIRWHVQSFVVSFVKCWIDIFHQTLYMFGDGNNVLLCCLLHVNRHRFLHYLSTHSFFLLKVVKSTPSCPSVFFICPSKASSHSHHLIQWESWQFQ